MQKILITGITGFVGSHMADLLLEKPDIEVYGLKRWHLSRLDHIQHHLNNKRLILVDCDITDPISAREAIRKIMPDKVFHFAAMSFVAPSWENPSVYMDVNYKGTVNLLDAIREAGINPRFHIAGSGEEYGEIHEDELPINDKSPLRPVNPYSVSKIAQDLIGYVYHRSYAMNVVRTRAFNHEGPRRDKVFGIPWYAYQVARIEAGMQEPVMRVGYTGDRRNFTHIRDMVEAYWLAMEYAKPGELYVIGADEPEHIYTFHNALEQLISMSDIGNKKIEIVTAPEYVRPTQVPRLIGDTTKFREITGWKPKIKFETILSDTLNYWRERLKAGTA